jgi:hypothetical protein
MSKRRRAWNAYYAAGGTPDKILGPSLLAWYRSDKGVTVTGSGVSTWADQSGTGDANKNAVQAVDANRPPLVASDANFNNLPSINFAATKFLKTGVWAVAMAGPTTVFIVGMTTSNGTCWYVNSLGNPMGMFSAASNFKMTDEGSVLASGASTANIPSIMVCVFNDPSSTIAVRQNTPQNTGLAGTGAATGLTLGAFQDGSANLIGQMTEVIVANGPVSAGKIARVTAYASLRYAIAQGA